MAFTSKGPYIAFGISGHCIGEFDTLAKAKQSCSREESAPMGKWKVADDSAGKAYHADSGCTIYVGYDHPHVRMTKEEIGKATARFLWRETLR